MLQLWRDWSLQAVRPPWVLAVSAEVLAARWPASARTAATAAPSGRTPRGSRWVAGCPGGSAGPGKRRPRWGSGCTLRELPLLAGGFLPASQASAGPARLWRPSRRWPRGVGVGETPGSSPSRAARPRAAPPRGRARRGACRCPRTEPEVGAREARCDPGGPGWVRSPRQRPARAVIFGARGGACAGACFPAPGAGRRRR